jgi:hypothetical protein
MDRAIAAGCADPADRIGRPKGRADRPDHAGRSRFADHALPITLCR